MMIRGEGADAQSPAGEAATLTGAADRVANRLREDIRAGRLAPGQRLVEAELTGRLGVSRGPVREAMARLRSEGLVRIEPYRGASVRRMSRNELADLFWVRARLAADSASLAAARIEEGDNAERMQAELGRQRKLRGADIESYSEANLHFHALIDELSGNAVLASVLHNLDTHAGVFLHLATTDDRELLIDQHLAIAEAILAGDRRAAAHQSRRHVEAVLKAIEDLPDEWFA